jgi:hypothetical protein
MGLLKKRRLTLHPRRKNNWRYNLLIKKKNITKNKWIQGSEHCRTSATQNRRGLTKTSTSTARRIAKYLKARRRNKSQLLHKVLSLKVLGLVLSGSINGKSRY